MTAALRRFLRTMLPAPLHAALTRHRRIRFTGPYRNWADATAAGTGYDAPTILARMTASAHAVAAGHAAYERDTVLFPTPAADPLLLAELTALAPLRPAGLRVLDFGGALGSTWFQHRTFFDSFPPVDWHIVEQPAIASRGRAEFTRPGLTFHDSLEDALVAGPPDLVLLSSVLHYLPAPWSQLERLVALPARAWLVTRTPVSDALHTDHAVVQHVPPVIYRASYPAWIFPAASFASFATAHRLSLVWHRCTDGHFTLPGLAFEFRTAVFYSREIGFPPPPAALA